MNGSSSKGGPVNASVSDRLEWVGCSMCGRSSQSELLLSNCGHVYCKQCKGEGCTLCSRSSVKFIPITAGIKQHPQVGHLFCNVNQSLKRMIDIVAFRDMHSVRVQAHCRKAFSQRLVTSQRSLLRPQVTERRQELVAGLKEGEKLVKLLRARGIQDKDIFMCPTPSGEMVNGARVLQQTVKLLNATKPGADLHRVATVLRSQQPTAALLLQPTAALLSQPTAALLSQPTASAHTVLPQCRPHSAPSKATPVSTTTPVSKATPVSTTTPVSKATPVSTTIPVSKATPLSQRVPGSYYTARGSAVLSASRPPPPGSAVLSASRPPPPAGSAVLSASRPIAAGSAVLSASRPIPAGSVVLSASRPPPAAGSAVLSASRPIAAKSRSTVVTLQAKRQFTNTQAAGSTPTGFTLNTFSGSAAVRRPLSQHRTAMPPPPPPPTLTLLTSSCSAPNALSNASPKTMGCIKRWTPTAITPSPHIYPQSMQRVSGGGRLSAGRRSMEGLSSSSYTHTPSPHGGGNNRKRTLTTPDSGGRVSMRPRPSGGRLVPHMPSPMAQGTPIRMELN